MELNNDFRVSVPPVEAWKVLTDVERIAPLLPGAQLQEVEGDDYRGIVKVKVGPITAQYKGTATFLEQDQPTGHLVLKATGRDTRGQGNASAIITVNMGPEGDGTKVGVVTDLTITGKVAQFGRGVLAEVTEKLINQFVEALEADIQSGGNPDGQRSIDDADGGAPVTAAADTTPDADGKVTEEPPAPAAPEESASEEAGPRQVNHPEPEPVDLINAAGGSVAKRLAPLAGFALLLFVFIALRRRGKARLAAQVAAAQAAEAAQAAQAAQEAAQAALAKPGLAAARAALPDLSSAQEAGMKAAKLAGQAAAAELKQLAAAQEQVRKSAKQAQQAAATELKQLAAAKEQVRRAAKQAREAARQK